MLQKRDYSLRYVITTTIFCSVICDKINKLGERNIFQICQIIQCFIKHYSLKMEFIFTASLICHDILEENKMHTDTRGRNAATWRHVVGK